MVKPSTQISLKLSKQEMGLFGDSTYPKPLGEVDYLNDLFALLNDV